jgi:hypothetical protein
LLKNGVSGRYPALCGFDGFVNMPISALRLSALSLRRTGSTPHSTRFARLELGLFTKPSLRMTFNGFINFLNLSFPENEGAVKGNFPAGVFMPVRGVMRTSWVWEPVIFFADL